MRTRRPSAASASASLDPTGVTVSFMFPTGLYPGS